MMLFMVVERFRPGKAPEIYRRFQERGRMVPDVISNDCRACQGMIGACGHVLEIGYELSTCGVNSEEVVHIDRGAFTIGSAFCHQRNGTGNSTTACIGANPGSRTFEPGFNRECR